MRSYLHLLQKVLEDGETRQARTAIGTKSIFGERLQVNLQDGFPLLTTKKLHLKSVIYELLWFLRGSTNITFLQEHGVQIWDEWADEKGELGPVYGKQWRAWDKDDGSSVDQIACLIENIGKNPTSRRLLVSAWNVGVLDKMALPPCHVLFQFYVSQDKYLSCQVYQRSADLFLGVPFNMASYALLTMMIAQVCKLVPYRLSYVFGDVHLYLNHLEQARLQCQRSPKALPRLHLNPSVQDIFSFSYEDFRLDNYQPHPHIKAQVSV